MFGLFESKEAKKERMLSKGTSAMAAGRFTEAEGCFLKAIELDIFNASEAWTGLGAIYYANELFQKSKDCFRSAIDQGGGYHAIRGMALVERKFGNDDHSIELFRQLSEKFGYRSVEDPTLTPLDRSWLRDNGI